MFKQLFGRPAAPKPPPETRSRGFARVGTLARGKGDPAAIGYGAEALPPRVRRNRRLWAAPRPHPESLRILDLDDTRLERLRAERPRQGGA
jgi:hypothetical protein